MFASIGSSYLHSDVFNIDELVAVAHNFSVAEIETGENREKLEEKYTELRGIWQFHDFVK